jgi:carbon monoxide dehydrogenase subunit G
VELTHQFTVPVSVADAWEAFNDLERITPCFPGAALTSFDGESFTGGVKVKLGPISMQYTGTGKFVERDEAAHRAVVEAKGRDKRGNGTASATVTAELADAGEAGTSVMVRTDLNVTGKPAQFGRGVMQDVSDKLLGQFATCLESRLAAPSQSESPQTAAEPEPADPAVAAESAVAAEPAKAADAATPAEPVAAGPPATSADDSAHAEGVPQPVGVTSPAAETPAAPSAASGRPDQTPAAELDLGSTVLPILLKRFAPQLLALVVVVWILSRLRRRRSRRRTRSVAGVPALAVSIAEGPQVAESGDDGS